MTDSTDTTASSESTQEQSPEQRWHDAVVEATAGHQRYHFALRALLNAIEAAALVHEGENYARQARAMGLSIPGAILDAEADSQYLRGLLTELFDRLKESNEDMVTMVRELHRFDPQGISAAHLDATVEALHSNTGGFEQWQLAAERDLAEFIALTEVNTRSKRKKLSDAHQKLVDGLMRVQATNESQLSYLQEIGSRYPHKSPSSLGELLQEIFGESWSIGKGTKVGVQVYEVDFGNPGTALKDITNVIRSL